MKLKPIIFISFISVFIWQGVADAASISTRVRVLESKVAKHDKQFKESVKSQQASEVKMEKSLAKMKALEKKMQKLLNDETAKKKKGELTDKRYAFP